MSKHRRPGDRRPGLALAAASVAAVTLLGASSPAMAAKGGGGRPSGGSTAGASCSVNPDPVTVGADWTLTGSGLGAGAIVNILLTDSAGTTSWNLEADATGTVSLTWHSYWSGTTRVTFQKTQRHGFATVTTCSFAVT